VAKVGRTASDCHFKKLATADDSAQIGVGLTVWTYLDGIVINTSHFIKLKLEPRNLPENLQ